MSTSEPDATVRVVADILIAYLQNNTVAPSELPRLAKELMIALEGTSGQIATLAPDHLAPGEDSTGAAKPCSNVSEAVSAIGLRGEVTQAPAVPIESSIQDEYLISLEDGRRYRSLRRHLMAKYGMTPEEYRTKWKLPPDYPMVAPSYARERSEVAKRIGLGHSKGERRSASRRTR